MMNRERHDCPQFHVAVARPHAGFLTPYLHEDHRDRGPTPLSSPSVVSETSVTCQSLADAMSFFANTIE
jgi:hypothetical protein